MDRTVKRFWSVVSAMSAKEKAALLRFVTSCERPPPLGFESMQPPFCVHRVGIRSDGERLPTASTCFNTLKLPTYSSEKVRTIISSRLLVGWLLFVSVVRVLFYVRRGWCLFAFCWVLLLLLFFEGVLVLALVAQGCGVAAFPLPFAALRHCSQVTLFVSLGLLACPFLTLRLPPLRLRRVRSESDNNRLMRGVRSGAQGKAVDVHFLRHRLRTVLGNGTVGIALGRPRSSTSAWTAQMEKSCLVLGPFRR